MLSLTRFIKRHLVSTFLCLIMIAGVAVGNLTSHTEALLDTLLVTIDPTSDGSASAVSLIADIDDTPVDEETSAPISSNWAYDHANGTTSHDSIYVNKTQGFTAFTGSDATPDVSGGEFFETADTTSITDFDDGGDSSTLVDGQMCVVLCLHAGEFDFTSSGLTSPYGEDFTMIVGATEVFMYDLSNTTWKWVTPKSPSAAVSSNGFLVRTGAGAADARTINGTANEVEVDDNDGSEGNLTISLPDTLITNYNATPDAMSDDTYNGNVIIGVNFGETVGQWACVFLASDGKVDIADADAAGEFPALGIVVAGGDDTDAATILVQGVVRNEGWTGLTVGGAVYLGDGGAGAITQTAPSTSGDCVQIIGRALSDSEIYFNFTPHYLEVE